MAYPRLTLRPSALGTKGMLLFAALSLAFLATNYNNLFFLLLAFSAVLGTLDAVWAICNLRGMGVRAVTVGPAAEGSERPISVALSAPRRGRFAIAIAAETAAGTTEIARVAIVRGEHRITGTVPPQPRGVYALNRLWLRSCFPFGFFVAQRVITVRAELLTHPAPAPIADNAHRHAQFAGHGASKAGRGSAVAGLREFRDGDAIADVHWKATARRGNAVIKEREHENGDAIEAVLDLRLPPDALKLALSQATALVLAARHGAPLALRSQDGELRVDARQAEADEALRWLATARPLPPDAPPPAAGDRGLRLPLDQKRSK